VFLDGVAELVSILIPSFLANPGTASRSGSTFPPWPFSTRIFATPWATRLSQISNTTARKVSFVSVSVPLRSIQCGEMPTGTGVATMTRG